MVVIHFPLLYIPNYSLRSNTSTIFTSSRDDFAESENLIRLLSWSSFWTYNVVHLAGGSILSKQMIVTFMYLDQATAKRSLEEKQNLYDFLCCQRVAVQRCGWKRGVGFQNRRRRSSFSCSCAWNSFPLPANCNERLKKWTLLIKVLSTRFCIDPVEPHWKSWRDEVLLNK